MTAAEAAARPRGKKKPLVPGSTKGQRADVTVWSAGALVYYEENLHASTMSYTLAHVNRSRLAAPSNSLRYKDFLLLGLRLVSCSAV
jgi:hypothetical protein